MFKGNQKSGLPGKTSAFSVSLFVPKQGKKKTVEIENRRNKKTNER